MSKSKNSKEPENSRGGIFYIPEILKREKRSKINSKAQKAAMEAAMQMRSQSNSLGSYTGTAHDGGAPQQDADDL